MEFDIGDTFIFNSVVEGLTVWKVKPFKLYKIDEKSEGKAYFQDDSGRYRIIKPNSTICNYITKMDNSNVAKLNYRDLDMLIDLSLAIKNKELFLHLTNRRYDYLYK